MTKARKEIEVLEERLRQAELAPDPETFEDLLADTVVLVDQSGTPALAKRKVVEAHRAGQGPKFTAVEISDLRIVGAAIQRRAEVHARLAAEKRALADRRRLDPSVAKS